MIREDSVFMDAFVEAAMEWNRLRNLISNFREPTEHVREWTELSAAFVQAEKKMRIAYLAVRTQ